MWGAPKIWSLEKMSAVHVAAMAGGIIEVVAGPQEGARLADAVFIVRDMLIRLLPMETRL
jgi:hypothetical protein